MMIPSLVYRHWFYILLTILNTLLSLVFISLFSLIQDVDHARLNKTRLIASLLIMLPQLFLVITSFSLSTKLPSYFIALDPPILLAYWFYLQRIQLKTSQRALDHPLQVQIEDALRPKKFKLEDIKKATRNFKNLVAISHYCKVYRGTLADGNSSGIMRIRCPKDRRTYSAFVNEISTISHSKHDNIMKLLGYCLAPDFVYFAYEYMDNHRLKDWIFNDDINKRRTLTMELRYQIGVDVSKALGYLNNHRKNFLLDVNPSNILLDIKFKAKVTDFGLWRLLVETKGNLDNMTITCEETGRSTEKHNVYHYGVFLLELVSGMRHWSSYDDGEIVKIVYWKVKEGKHMELVDQVLEVVGEGEEKLLVLLRVALLCVQEVCENRPSMAQMIGMLVGHETVPTVQQIPTMLNMSNNETALSVIDDCDEIFLWADQIRSKV